MALLHDEEGSSAVVEAIAAGTTISVVNSLADRACLALAERLGVPAVTADREWAKADVAAEVQLIR
jgi:PIN domain nuclease of toxin-antitoxin system